MMQKLTKNDMGVCARCKKNVIGYESHGFPIYDQYHWLCNECGDELYPLFEKLKMDLWEKFISNEKE